MQDAIDQTAGAGVTALALRLLHQKGHEAKELILILEDLHDLC